MSDKVKAHHLSRKAILYIRQSSAYQVHHNQESRRLQYAMADRIRQLGWSDVEVIDDDLGQSASGTVARTGFDRMVADVCMGNVGAVAAREVSRFARNSKDWQQLVEVCRVVDTLLIDQDSIYCPRGSNDRLLLGLKGSMNEYELDLLRQRSLEARYEKAKRGELLVSVPIGFLKTEIGTIEKDPDRRIQETIGLVFQKFSELQSARQTLMWFLEHNLKIPTRRHGAEVKWKRPKYASIYYILTNPVYGGAYAYGKTKPKVDYADGVSRKSVRRLPKAQWLALIPNHHEGYVGWHEFQRIQAVLADNNVMNFSRGAPKHGLALLTGLLRCRRCGRKLTVQYTGATHRYVRYACRRGNLDNGQPRCISFGGIHVDKRIADQVFDVVSPAGVEAACEASRQEAKKHDEVIAALRRDLEAARYAARRAERQFNAADPENRLVVDELERRWNQALEHVQDLESRVQSHNAGESLHPGTIAEFSELAENLKAVWDDEATDVRLKKQIIRTLIKEVVADVDSEAGEIILVIHWRGGVHTELRVPRRRRGQCGTQTSTETVDIVRRLALICSDDVIASTLNRNDISTGRGNRWTRERVASLRVKNGIPAHSRREPEEGWMNLSQSAEFLGISPRTLRSAVERGKIKGEHPLNDGPWLFNRVNLETESAKTVVERAKQRSTRAAVPSPDQQTLQFTEE